MSDDKHRPEPTQTIEKGLTIPVPTREEHLRNFKNLAPKPELPEVGEKPNAE